MSSLVALAFLLPYIDDMIANFSTTVTCLYTIKTTQIPWSRSLQCATEPRKREVEHSQHDFGRYWPGLQAGHRQRHAEKSKLIICADNSRPLWQWKQAWTQESVESFETLAYIALSTTMTYWLNREQFVSTSTHTVAVASLIIPEISSNNEIIMR